MPAITISCAYNTFKPVKRSYTNTGFTAYNVLATNKCKLVISFEDFMFLKNLAANFTVILTLTLIYIATVFPRVTEKLLKPVLVLDGMSIRCPLSVCAHLQDKGLHLHTVWTAKQSRPEISISFFWGHWIN